MRIDHHLPPCPQLARWPAAPFATALFAAALLVASTGAPTPAVAIEPAEAAALFESLDLNHDDVVSASEAPNDKQPLFERLVRRGDANSDGQLTRDELSAALTTQPPAGRDRAPERPLKPGRLFERFDSNGDGKVDRDEAPAAANERFKRLLERADADHDGAITREELRAAIPLGRPAGDGQPGPGPGARILALFDRDGDGKIGPDEVAEGRRDQFERLLQRADANRDGALDPSEWRMAIRGGDRPMPPPGGPGAAGRRAADRPESDNSSARAIPAGPTRGDKRSSRAAKKVLTPERIERRVLKQDDNQDGLIQRAEFADKRMKQFDRLDANHDGVLDQGETHAFAQGVAERAAQRPKQKKSPRV